MPKNGRQTGDVIWAFIAGAAAACILCLGTAYALAFLMARVNGEVAKILAQSVSESLQGLFHPPATQSPAEGAVEAEEPTQPVHGPEGLWLQDEDVPPWEEDSMEPLEIRQ